MLTRAPAPAGGKKGDAEKPKLNPLYEEATRWVVPAHGQVELVALFQVSRRGV